MKTFLWLLFTIFTVAAYSQSETIIVKKMPYTITIPKINKDSMRNALSGIVFNQKKLGNNNGGFDVYRAELDNMPVLKPDSNFYSSMPNAYTANNKMNALLQQLQQRKDAPDIQEIQPYHFKLLKPLPKNKFQLPDAATR